MSKIKWTETPFETLEQARGIAEKMQLYPTAIVITDPYKSFQVREGKKQIVVAQALKGGPVLERVLSKTQSKPPLQDPTAPKFSEEEDRLRVGPWTPSEHEIFQDVKDHISKQYINPDNLEFHTLLMFIDSGDEYQYYKAPTGQMYVRVLSKKK